MPNQVPMPEHIRAKISASKKGKPPLAAIKARRNYIKWPHPSGRRCKCGQCENRRYSFYELKLKSVK